MDSISEFFSVRDRLNYFIHLLFFVAVLFAISFALNAALAPGSFGLGSLVLTVFLVVAVAAILYGAKRAIAHLYHVKLSREKWNGGLIFSAVITFVLIAAGIPALVPIINTQAYNRAKTLRGLQKGEVNVHEKWAISMFSSMAFLAFGFLFLFIGQFISGLNGTLLNEAGAFFLIYVFINLLPYHRFDGAVLAYHNTVLYGVTLLLSLLTISLAAVSFTAGLGAFIAFVAVGLVTFRLKLW